MSSRCYFVTGTDTGVGKTWVSCQILRDWRAAGLRVAGLKAVESGCQHTASGLVGDDDERLVAAAGGWQPERCQFRFEPALAPGVAAELIGRSIDFQQIQQQVQRLGTVADRVLVEGAGGWIVPLGDDRTIETLARQLALKVLVVARAGLGTINHSVLTARAVTATGLELAGIVLNPLPNDDLEMTKQNQREIARLVSAPVVLADELRLLDL